MRTRSTNPPNAKSDTTKKLPPKKGATKPPTRPVSSDPVTESAAATKETKTDTTPTVEVPKTDEQTKQTLKGSASTSEAGIKKQAEVAREITVNPGALKYVEKKPTPDEKAPVAAVKTKATFTPRAKTADASKASTIGKVVTNSPANVNDSFVKEEAKKVAARGEQKEMAAKGGHQGVGDIKPEIGTEAPDQSVEPMENEELGGEEYGEEEEEPEEVDQVGEEMEDLGDGEGYEEAEIEEGDDEEGDDERPGEEEGEEEHNEMEVPASVQERSRKKELEVFVGGLDKDADEEDLRKVFSQVGDVVEVRLPRNPATNKNKGYAFIGFATNEQAKHAVT